MKILKILIVIFCIFLAGCESIDFRSAYPTHYTEDLSNRKCVRIGNAIIVHHGYTTIPNEVFRALPSKYKLAGLMNHLVVVQDKIGSIRYSDIAMLPEGLPMDNEGSVRTHNSEALRIKHSREFLYKVDELRERGMLEYRLPGYTNMVAFVDDLDYEDIIENQHAKAWLSWLREYQQNTDNLSKLILEGEELQRSLDNHIQLETQLGSQIQSLESAISHSRQRARRYWEEYEILRNEGLLYTKIPGLILSDTDYVYEEDPIRVVYDNAFVDVSANGWAMNDNVKNKTLHLDTVHAYERVLAIFKNPQRYYDPVTANKVKELTRPRIASLSRSIIHQAMQSNPSAAKWLDSDHAVGISVDMSMNGMNYNVQPRDSNGNPIEPSPEAIEKYHTFQKVLKTAGLTRTKNYSDRNERNHFTLTKYARTNDGKLVDDPNREIEERRYKLKAEILEASLDASNMSGEKLNEKIRAATGNNQRILDDIGDLNERIEEKLKEIEKKQKELNNAREDEKQARKMRDKEEDRIARARRRNNNHCLVSYQLDRNAPQFKLNAVYNSVKDWDCEPRGSRRGDYGCR
jgi:hypothetical protein